MDETKQPGKPHNYWQRERRNRDFDHYYIAHSSLKHIEGGVGSSFKAVRYYEKIAEDRRDELLAQFPKEE